MSWQPWRTPGVNTLVLKPSWCPVPLRCQPPEYPGGSAYNCFQLYSRARASGQQPQQKVYGSHQKVNATRHSQKQNWATGESNLCHAFVPRSTTLSHLSSQGFSQWLTGLPSQEIPPRFRDCILKRTRWLSENKLPSEQQNLQNSIPLRCQSWGKVSPITLKSNCS